MREHNFSETPDLPSKKKYQVLEKVSEGQFGTVFRAVNKETNQIVAIKKLYVSTKHNPQNSNHVLREIRCMGKINHENVIKLLDYKIKDASIKLVFDYMDYDLKSFIQNMPTPLKNSKVRKLYILLIQKLKGIAKMILEGLKAVHNQGIIHRDLKPSNILINAVGVVKIGDFGSAVHQDDAQNGIFEIEGFSRQSQWYKSPEMLYGSRSYDKRTDIWSFACIFGELLNGAPIFPGINDFDQLSRILKILGSPTPETWPGLESLPDYGKVMFNHQDPTALEKVFPNATKSELEFLKFILTYDRPKSIQEIIDHQYFKELPNPSRFKIISIKNDVEVKINYQTLLKLNQRS